MRPRCDIFGVLSRHLLARLHLSHFLSLLQFVLISPSFSDGEWRSVNVAVLSVVVAAKTHLHNALVLWANFRL